MESTLKYPISNHVDGDFFLIVRRNMVRTNKRIPGGNEPKARFENLSHSIGQPLFYE